jgi:hypothetical protein
MKGLIVDEPWISLIISGKKTWEMRSRNTLVRGRIALIRKGSKAVVGVAEIVRTIPKLSQSELRANVIKHRAAMHKYELELVADPNCRVGRPPTVPS